MRLWPLAAFLLLAPAAADATAADRLILRNLELIVDRTVTAVDDDGIQLDKPLAGGSSLITWDEIELGRISPELQGEFDRLLRELGPPLFKLRQRLRIGDYAGLKGPAEDLYPRYAQRQSQTAYLVCQSLMWGRLAAGEREQAVEPFLRSVALLSGGKADPRHLPGRRRLLVNAEVPVCGDLPPVWLDRQAARDALPAVQAVIKQMPTPRPDEAYVYYTSLAAAAGEFAEAEKVLEAIDGSKAGVKEVRQLLRAQLEVDRGNARGAAAILDPLAEAEMPAVVSLANYWRGLAWLAADDPDQKRDGLLSLLSIPANDKPEQAELAAAALYRSAQGLIAVGDAAGGAAVRREISTRYAATAVGVQSQSLGRQP